MENLGDDEERQLERQWCEYAMGVVEGEYLKELAKLDYGKGHNLVDAKVFRKKNIIPMHAYFLKTIFQKPVPNRVPSRLAKLPYKLPPPTK